MALILPSIKDHVELLDLDLKGVEDWDSDPDPDILRWDSMKGHEIRDDWAIVLNLNLIYLADNFKEARRLHSFRIKGNPQDPKLFDRDYLAASTICAFLSLSNLTSLELDLCGTGLRQDLCGTKYGREDGEPIHLCPNIAALLTTLRRLHVRMPEICPDVLKTKEDTRNNNLHLNEIIINLSLIDVASAPCAISALHATSCGTPDRWRGDLEVLPEMEKQVQNLVAQMAAPKIVRIITHTRLAKFPLPIYPRKAYDVLTGRTVKLREGAEWDDEGEPPIEKEVSEDEESEISDLHGDLEDDE